MIEYNRNLTSKALFGSDTNLHTSEVPFYCYKWPSGVQWRWFSEVLLSSVSLWRTITAHRVELCVPLTFCLVHWILTASLFRDVGCVRAPDCNLPSLLWSEWLNRWGVESVQTLLCLQFIFTPAKSLSFLLFPVKVTFCFLRSFHMISNSPWKH